MVLSLDYMQGVPIVELLFPPKTSVSRTPDVQVSVYHLAVTVLNFSSEIVVRIPPLVKNTVIIRLTVDFDFRTCTSTSSSMTQTLI